MQNHRRGARCCKNRLPLTSTDLASGRIDFAETVVDFAELSIDFNSVFPLKAEFIYTKDQRYRRHMRTKYIAWKSVSKFQSWYLQRRKIHYISHSQFGTALVEKRARTCEMTDKYHIHLNSQTLTSTHPSNRFGVQKRCFMLKFFDFLSS